MQSSLAATEGSPPTSGFPECSPHSPPRARTVPSAHLLLAGAVPEHYDLRGDIERHGLESQVTLTGYVPTDEAFTGNIAACDVALNLRWPTAREMSGPWLRCLAAGKPTVIVDLAHLANVPTLDPRTWQPNAGSTSSPAPCAVAIDILDEDHSLRLAMRRLGTDPVLREMLGRTAVSYWQSEHSIDRMVADYRNLMEEAVRRPVPRVSLPRHLLDEARGTLNRLMAPFGRLSPLAPSDGRGRATSPI